jgi:hypothetical protein|tara:strand:+ start:2258 stop:2506 length:249 start_codon:yes stop_codon:yes gene_type:complete
MTEKEVMEEVEMWNWNLNIFEIYDSVRYESEGDQAKLLNYAFKFFNQDSMIGDLAYHLDVELEKVETTDYGRVVAKIEKELP